MMSNIYSHHHLFHLLLPHFQLLFCHIQILYLYALPRPHFSIPNLFFFCFIHTYQSQISYLHHLLECIYLLQCIPISSFTVCIRQSISGWLPPYSFKLSIKTKRFNLLFPLPKLYPYFILRNISVDGRRGTKNSDGDNGSPWKISQFIFTAPGSVLLQIKFVFQFSIVSFSRFTIFLGAPTSSSDFIIHEWCIMS